MLCLAKDLQSKCRVQKPHWRREDRPKLRLMAQAKQSWESHNSWRLNQVLATVIIAKTVLDLDLDLRGVCCFSFAFILHGLIVSTLVDLL